jgi:hypothetical protein
MTYDADAEAVDLLDHLLFKQRRHSERTNSHLATPAIKMIIGNWHVDELGIRTREVTARD